MSRVLIVEARFYEDIADELVRGAVQHLEAAGVEYDRVTVPGAFEIPGAISMAHQGSLKGGVAYDGYVALGCVIRGDTTHYDYVCGESARGLNQLAIDRKACIGYGILTVENREQAWARARADRANKGADVASACLRMIEIKRQFQQG